MKPFPIIVIPIFLLAAACTASPYGRADIPTARPLTSTPVPTSTAPAAEATNRESTAAPQPTQTQTATTSPTRANSPTPTPTQPPTQTPTPTPTPEPVIGTVASASANVYAGPGLDYGLLAILTAGFRVEALGASTNGDWVLIALPRGAVGWVWESHLSPIAIAAGLPEVPAPPRPAATATIAAKPLVIVSPVALAPGAEYTISLRNFAAHEKITVKVIFEGNGFTIFKVDTVARANGTQEVTLTTSSIAPVGVYLVTATGDAGSSAGAAFYVGPPPEAGGY